MKNEEVKPILTIEILLFSLMLVQAIYASYQVMHLKFSLHLNIVVQLLDILKFFYKGKTQNGYYQIFC